MACIAIALSDVTSKRLAAYRLGRRLRDAGHEVVMIVRDPAHAADDLDHRVLDLHPVDDGVRRRFRLIAQWRAVRRAADAIPVERVEPLLVDIGADLILIDNEEHELSLAVVAGGRSAMAALLHFQFSIWPDSGRPPLDHAMPVADSSRDRWRVRMAWTATRLRMRYRDLRYHVAGRKIERAPALRRLARRLGVGSHLDRRVWLHPFVPTGLPTIVLGSADLDLPGSFPDEVVHVGPLLDEVEERADDDPFAAFVAAAAANGRRVVTCVFGAFVDAAGAGVLDRLVEVAEARPDLEFIVGGVGDRTASETIVRRTTNLATAAWIPQRWLLERSDAAIVHSGTFTLHECVAAEVPMLVYPFPVNDQLGNAERVRHHGLGVVGDRVNDAAVTMGERLDGLLADEDARGRLRVMRQRIDIDDQVASREIERLLRR